jgi:hypothetical protein
MGTFATWSVSIPEPPFGQSYKCRKRSPGSRPPRRSYPTPSKRDAVLATRRLAGPNPPIARRHAATAVAVVVIGPIIETRPDAGEEKVSAKAEAVVVKATEATEVKMAETRAGKATTIKDATTEAATIETMTGEAVSAEAMTGKPAVATAATEAAATMASAATVRHRTGRQCCAKRNSRDDRNRSCRPPHESLSSFAELRLPDGGRRAEVPDRRSQYARRSLHDDDPFFVARSAAACAFDISKRAEMLKLLMRQFLTHKSVFRPKVCASYFADLVGESGR